MSLIEWELAAEDVVVDGVIVLRAMSRTGRWRRRQFYSVPGVLVDKRPLGERTPCEWREGKPR